MQNIPEILIEKYKKNPEKIILYIQKRGKNDLAISYADLIVNAGLYTQLILEKNVKPGDIGIILLQHGEDLVYAYFGAILAGIIPSIMPLLTEKLLPERYRGELKVLLQITDPRIIITYQGFSKEVFAALKNNTQREVIITDNIPLVNQPSLSQFPGLKMPSKNIVLLQHSSGTTGLQKGVALSHKAIIKQLQNYRDAINLNERDVFVSWLPLYHDMGLIAGFLMPILFNIPLVLMSPFDWVRAPYLLHKAISEYKGTLCWLPNFAYNFCAQKIRDHQIEGVDLSSLRAVINCSEPMRWNSHELFYERFKKYGFRRGALATCYAMAENVFAVTQGGIDEEITIDEIDRETFQREKKAIPQPANSSNLIKMVSAGQAINGTEIKIVDQNGKSLPERCIGEILIKSDYMLTEYYNRPDATKKSFLGGWFKTGDFGYIAGGELYISGRKKDLIIVGGKNIYPQDLEALAMEVDGVHPGRVVAFGVENEVSGTEDVIIIAEIEKEFRDQKEKISEEIRKVISKGSAISPKQIYLADKKWLVKTSSGKTARAANKEKYLKEIKTIS